MADNNRIITTRLNEGIDREATVPQNQNADRETTIPQNQNADREATIPQNQNVDRDSTMPQTENVDRDSTIPQNQENSTSNIEDLLENTTYISNDGKLKFELKRENRLNVTSGESVLFKDEINIDGEKIEGVVKVFKKFDHKKFENRKEILQLVYEKREEVEENSLARVISYGKVTVGSKEYFAEIYRYYSGGDLFNKQLNYDEIEKKVIPSLLKALRYLHSHKIVHRDIKPENIYIDKDGKVYLGDFGIAHYIGEESIDFDNQKIGTPGYSAPELLDSKNGIVSIESDYYSLGQTLYTLYTGKLMYRDILKMPISGDEKVNKLIEKMKYNEYIEMHRLNNHPLFEALIRGLLRNSLADRFKDEDIEKFLNRDYSLMREVKMVDNDIFSEPLRIYGKTLFSKEEIFDFMIKNTDKIDEILNFQWISKNFEKNNRASDKKEMETIESEYLKDDESEKKYQIYKLYKFLKNEDIFIWDNKEINDHRGLLNIQAGGLKKLLNRGELQKFLTKLNIPSSFIDKLEDIKDYDSEVIASILSIYFDPNNAKKLEKEFTYQGKNLNSLIIDYLDSREKIDGEPELLKPLLALLHIYGYHNINTNSNDFFLTLEDMSKENNTKIRVRKLYLKSEDITLVNDTSVKETYKNLLFIIDGIKKKEYKATGEKSKQILKNMLSFEILPNKMNINEIGKTLTNFESEYLKFENRFENNPYIMSKTTDDDNYDFILTKCTNRYLNDTTLDEDAEIFQNRVLQNKREFYELTKGAFEDKKTIIPLFLVAIISFALGYTIRRSDLYIKYITIDNSIIKLLLPEFSYIFYSVGVYFTVKAVIFLVMNSTFNHEMILKKYYKIYSKNYKNGLITSLAEINKAIKNKDVKRLDTDYSGFIQKIDELNSLKEKYPRVLKKYMLMRKLQLILPIFSMMALLAYVFIDFNIFSNHYFMFKLYAYFLLVAVTYVMVIEKLIKTLYYSKSIILILSLISIGGMYFYKYSLDHTVTYNLGLLKTLDLHKVAVFEMFLFLVLGKNLTSIIETNRKYLLLILLIPGIMIPLTFLTSHLDLKLYYFYGLLTLPGAIGILSTPNNGGIGIYFIYKITFLLLAYSLLEMTGTAMPELNGLFDIFTLFIAGDLIVKIIHNTVIKQIFN